MGHEIDFTISDFTADLRAATPTAAMELATPDKNDIFAFIDDFLYNSSQNIGELFADKREKINLALNSYGFRIPLDLVRRKQQTMDNLIYRVQQNINKIFMIAQNKTALLTRSIESHDVKRSLRKGFALVKQESRYITRAGKFDAGKKALLEFYDGEITLKGK